MSVEVWWVLWNLLWIPTVSVFFLMALKGYTSTPRFDTWFWGSSLALALVVLGISIAKLAN